MTDRVYLTVASFCLVEAIEKLKSDGCVELGLSKQDGNWLLSFNLPCKKMQAANDNELLPEEDRPPVEEKENGDIYHDDDTRCKPTDD